MNKKCMGAEFAPFKMRGSTLEDILDKSVTEVVIPEGVTEIEYGAFSNCTALTSVVFPNSLLVLKGFKGCSSLTSVKIPDNVKDLWAFEGCTSLTSVTIPNSVTYLRGFDDCTSLTSVVISDRVKELYGFSGCTALSTAVIPNSVEDIGEMTFSKCTALTSVVIPNSVERIHERAFRDCNQLKTIRLENKKTTIGKYVFSFSETLEYVDIEVLDNFSVEDQCQYFVNSFPHWDSISKEERKEQISYIKRKKKLKELLFLSKSPELISLMIEEKIKLSLEALDSYLEHAIAENRTEITAIYLDYKNKHYSQEQKDKHAEHKDMLEIGLELPTFTEFRKKWRISKKEGVLSITEYKGSEKIETIPHHLKDGTPIKYLKIENTSFEELHIEADLDSDSVIEYDNSIKEVTFAECVTKLPKIRSCNALESVNIPKSVIEIGGFSSCSSLQSIVIPDSVTEIGSFSGCSSLQTFVIPDSVTKIGSLSSCTSLQSIVIPDSVTEIGSFYDCTSLQSIVIPDSVTKIWRSTFSGCTSLQSIVIPDSVTEIGERAFMACKGLKSIVISDSVTNIGGLAFSDCRRLTIKGKTGSYIESYCQENNLPFKAIS